MKRFFILTAMCLFALLSLNAQTINNLYVSPTGYAMWEDGNTPMIYDIYLDGELAAQGLTTTYYQHESLVDGKEYKTRVVPFYATGAEGNAVEYSWTKTACDEFEGVTDLTADSFDGKAIISWTFPTIDDRAANASREGTWLHYDNGIYSESINLIYDGTTCEPFKWGIMFPSSDLSGLAGQVLSKVSLYNSEQFEGEVFIHKGGSNEPGTLVYSQKFSCPGSNDFYEVTLNTPVEINGNENIWVILTHYNAWQPATGCADQGDPNGRWLYFEGFPWIDNSLVSIPPFTWMIRAFIGEATTPTEILGAMLYRNGERLSEELITKSTYIDKDAKDGDEYTVRVVYGGEKDVVHYGMSCPQSVKFNMISVDKNDANVMMVYPNPTDGNLNIKAKALTHIAVINALGQTVYERKANSDNEVINMSQYSKGIYMLRITTENGVSVRQISLAK